MRNILSIAFCLIVWFSCSIKEELVSFDPSLELLFSQDTVSFDTLLSETRSSTKRLRVFNPNEEAIMLNSIVLGNGTLSDYSLVINGKETNASLNETIFGGDSLLILIQVNIHARNLDEPYLVSDSIIFDWNSNSEHVKLISYGQDATNLSNQVLCNARLTNTRPYIVSDMLIVEADCHLTIEKGTEIYFENDALLAIEGTLTAIGDSAEHIVFRNSRFDGIYDDVPGQWDGIYFLEGSQNNEISYAEIFNAQVGLRIGSPDQDNIPDLIVSNSRIFNMSSSGILAFTSDVEVTNTLIYNCGTYLVGNFAGGNYTYNHCTLTNDPSPFVQNEPSVQFADNIVTSEDEILVEDLFVEINNSIIWGEGSEELLVSNAGGGNLSLSLRTNIIRSVSEIDNNFTSTDYNFPGFKDLFGYDYSLDTLAFAKDKGSDIGVFEDILGFQRDSNPDIGAFERIEN